MDYKSYEKGVESTFNVTERISLSGYHMLTAYEEVFKWIWIGTKQKIYTYVTYTENAGIEQMKELMKLTYSYSKKNYRGLPRGFQTGLMTYVVLVCEHVDEELIHFVENKEHLHFAAVEMPLVYDLKKECLYSLKEYPLVGCIYNKFKKEYISSHFKLKTRN